MKNLKMISMFAVLIMAFSCNSDDNSDSNIVVEETGFFSDDVLKVGNKWVYKTYDNRHTITNPANYEFTGKVDTLEVIDRGNINGVEYAVRRVRSYNINTNSLLDEKVYYERINNKNHWIIMTSINGITEESGFVRHPGNDFEFSYNQNYEGQGDIEYKLYENENIIVEGQNYEAAPYKGYFTPTGDSEPLLSKTVVYNYNKDVGLVKLICHSVLGTHTWEERLVSFTRGN